MRPIVPLIALTLLASCSSASKRAQTLSFSTGWHAAETNGAGNPAKWEVLPDGQVRRGVLQVVTTNTGQTYNLFLTDASDATDVDVGVWLRAISGDEDRGGGVVWRARDADNYYITRWNPLEDNVRVYKVVNGVRSEMGSLDVKLDPQAWHHIRAVVEGAHMTVYLDGHVVLEEEDGTFPGPGAVGLWTKADASVFFDDFEVVW
jgi:hypothetical protein